MSVADAALNPTRRLPRNYEERAEVVQRKIINRSGGSDQRWLDLARLIQSVASRSAS